MTRLALFEHCRKVGVAPTSRSLSGHGRFSRISHSQRWMVPAVAFLALSCTKPPTVVGVWHGTLLDQEATTEFKDDKTMTLDLKAGEMGASLQGTYTVTPKILAITISSYKLKNVPEALQPLATKIFDPLKGKTYSLKYQFNSKDELALTYQGKVDILKRQVAE